MKKPEAVGHLLAFVTTIMWGTSFISTKVLLNCFNPLEILFFRFLLGYLALWALYPHRLKLERKKDKLWLFLAALTGVTIYFLCENTALTYTLAANVSVLVAVAPFLTGLLSQLTGNGKMTGGFLLGFLISIVGICLISYSGSAVLKLNPLGDILALAAALMWALYSIFTDKANEGKAYPVFGVTRRIFLYGILTMLPCMAVMDFKLWDPARLQPKVILNLLYLGLCCSAAGYLTWNKAMGILGTIKTSAYIYLIPLVTLIFSALVLRERITWISMVGTVLVLGGLVLSEWKNKNGNDK